MAKHYYYEVDYTCVCEVCGKEIQGTMKRGPLEYNGGLLTTGMASLADAGDMVLSKKLIESAVNGTGNQPYQATNANCCPHCGARQSWYPMEQPKKASGIGCLLLMGFFGGCVGLLIWASLLMDYDFLGPILLCVGIAGGIIPVICYNRKHRDEEKQRAQEYQKAYDAYMESLKTRTVHNKPDIHWETARRNDID